MLFVCHPKILRKHCFQFLLGVKMALQETENNAYPKFWGDKQRALWYGIGFLEWSILSPVVDQSIHNLATPARLLQQFHGLAKCSKELHHLIYRCFLFARLNDPSRCELTVFVLNSLLEKYSITMYGLQ